MGFSGYRIDLAVVHPSDENRYLLGIECDGATFHSAKSVKERDVMRQKFLEGKGWIIERIWSRNWWKNPKREIDRIDARINELARPHVEQDARQPPHVDGAKTDGSDQMIAESLDLIKARPNGVYMKDLKTLLDASQEEMSRLATYLRRMDGVTVMEIHRNAKPFDFLFMYKEPGTAADPESGKQHT